MQDCSPSILPSSSTSPLPECVVLHPEDANSKVFCAIARALVAVDNRALTVKDLAEGAMRHGLQAQSVSAASQAITTYIRLHLDRCQKQNDIPLLCQHKLSGTSIDDCLIPALASTSGGASAPLDHAPLRATNFRKGTVVWFLSRATGIACPFTRAGIRLQDLADRSPVLPALPPRDRRSDLKRKRTLRGTSPNPSHSDTDRPPPKVRITLKLKPIATRDGSMAKTISSRIIHLSDSEDDSDASMSVQEPECLPPYPRRTISIPCYTPSVEKPYLYFPPVQPQPLYRRSPSAALSTASPPPDSDEDMILDGPSPSAYQPPLLEDDSDFDADSEGDADTSWEDIPMPRSPSTSSLLPPVRVKREADIHPFSTSWGLDDLLGHPSAYEAEVTAKIKTEAVEPDSFTWDKGYQGYSADDEGSFPIKQEEPILVLSSLESSPYQAAPSPSSSSTSSDAFDDFLVTPFSPRLDLDHSVSTKTVGPLPHSLVSLIESMSVTDTLHEPCVSPQDCTANSVVTPSGLPQDAPITATQIEGIPVYQMPTGSYNLLRRMDTDFVNLATLAAYAGTPLPVWNTIPTATPVVAGSPGIVGTWVSLPTAQEYVRDHCSSDLILEIFVSDHLHQHFPSLQQTHLERLVALNQTSPVFGPPFGLHPRLQSDVASVLPPPIAPALPDGPTCVSTKMTNQSHHPSSLEDFPLSPTEQEMFQALCWEEEPSATSAPTTVTIPAAEDSDEEEEEMRSTRSSKQQPPQRGGLRRSKRVASQSQPTAPRVTQRNRRTGTRNAS